MIINRLLVPLLCVSILITGALKTSAQSVDTSNVHNSRMQMVNDIKKKGAGMLRKIKMQGGRYLSKDTILPAVSEYKKPDPAMEVPDEVKKTRTDRVDTSWHIGWRDGRMAEFNNAYTLRRHEVRLNIAGRSSYGLTDKLELSTYLPLIILPNVSFKYRFVDRPHFAIAYELGGAIGIIPVAVASGLVLPGGALGAGTIGVMTGNDVYAKLFVSWKPATKLTFSARGGISRMKLSYHGLGALVAAGNSDAVAVVLPVSIKLITTYFYMAGFEADYAMNRRNGINAKVSFGQFATRPGGVLYPSVTFTHAMHKHFHYSIGAFKLLDVPRYDILKEKTNNPLPFDIYYNFYWIFNNGRRHVKG